MEKIILSLALFLCFPVQASYITPPVKPKTPQINELISYYAERYNVSEEVLKIVIKCESGFNPKAVGDGGKSHGLVQIHEPSHPNITREQALDPDFAINFLAKNIASGKGRLWTCYRNNV